MTSHFLSTGDFSRNELEELLNRADALKAGQTDAKPLEGKSIALTFFNPSLRTRASMQVAIYELGGNAVILEPGSTSWTLEHRAAVVMDGDKTEHISEFVRVLGRYCRAIGVRTFAQLRDWMVEREDPVLSAIVSCSTVPVINLESAMHHPCQAMADMMTIREKRGSGRKRVLMTWAWHPKALPMAVPNSFMLAAAQMGHDVVVARPEGYDLDSELVAFASGKASGEGGKLEFTSDVDAAFESADIVYAKSWGSSQFYGDAEGELRFRRGLREKWIVNAEKMGRTNDAIFMHCLPVRRNVIVTDEVIDSPASVVIDEAENRLHVQKAILSTVVG